MVPCHWLVRCTIPWLVNHHLLGRKFDRGSSPLPRGSRARTGSLPGCPRAWAASEKYHTVHLRRRFEPRAGATDSRRRVSNGICRPAHQSTYRRRRLLAPVSSWKEYLSVGCDTGVPGSDECPAGNLQSHPWFPTGWRACTTLDCLEG